jgi:deoxyribodipyrimidine photo-lyase
MERAMRRGAEVVAPHLVVGEEAARARLDAFLDGPVERYARARDRLAQEGTSGLSENLTYGEIGPRTCWHAGHAALDAGRGDESWLKEIVWREFAYHLLHHFPAMPEATWRPEYRDFPWRQDNADAEAWRRGRTGVRVVDAAMRELYATGRMHNRGRLVTASYLTKHLMTHWRVGHDWFADCLIDWDVANNALNWQWVAGSGPDASPFFRVFNPKTQGEKFDPDRAYRRRWIAEGQKTPPDTALSFFEAVPRAWRLSPGDPYPAPVATAAAGRERALSAFRDWREARQEA